jgi:thioredoxin 1
MSDNVLEITDETYQTEIDKPDSPLVIDLWAPWCGPCRAVGPIVEELADEFAGRIRVGKMNVDDCQSAAASFGVQAIPTILFFNKGEEVDRVVGAQGKEALQAKFESLLGG